MQEDNQEYIDYNPQVIKLVDQETWQLIDDYIDIIVRTRKGPVSAKDVHALYRKQGTDEYEVTIKTVYRWLEKLEDHGLLEMVGYRKTARIPERLYHRTALVFFPEPQESAENWDHYKGKEYTDRMGNMLSGLLKTDIDLIEFYKIFKKYSITQHQVLSDVLDQIEENDELASFYRSNDIDEINEFNKYLSTFLLFTKHPNLVKKIQNLLS